MGHSYGNAPASTVSAADETLCADAVRRMVVRRMEDIAQGLCYIGGATLKSITLFSNRGDDSEKTHNHP